MKQDVLELGLLLVGLFDGFGDVGVVAGLEGEFFGGSHGGDRERHTQRWCLEREREWG